MPFTGTLDCTITLTTWDVGCTCENPASSGLAPQDSTARIWDALRGRCLATLSGHSGRLNRVSVDPGGSWAITTSDDQTARVWNVDTFACEHVSERGRTGHRGEGASRSCLVPLPWVEQSYVPATHSSCAIGAPMPFC